MTRVADQMRVDWDWRAKINPFHFICSQKDEWPLEEFWHSGEEDVERYLMPHVQKAGIDPKQASVLDFGCGVGRLSFALSKRFMRVTAYDVSPEMLAIGQQLLAEVTNISWVLGNGMDLGNVRDNSHDVVFSYITIQHIPDSRTAIRQLEELCRVLSPGGLMCIQFSHRRFYALRLIYNRLRSKLARSDWGWRILRTAWKQRKYGREELSHMETLMQHSLHPGRVILALERSGVCVESLDASDRNKIWLVGRKRTRYEGSY